MYQAMKKRKIKYDPYLQEITNLWEGCFKYKKS